MQLLKEPNETTIQILERWLRLAKDGRIIDIAVAAVSENDVTFTMSKNSNINMLLAATTALQQMVLDQHKHRQEPWVN